MTAWQTVGPQEAVYVPTGGMLPPGRSDYIRVRLFENNGEWWAEPIIGKSGLITTLVKSDGIAEIISEKEGISQGEYVPVIAMR